MDKYTDRTKQTMTQAGDASSEVEAMADPNKQREAATAAAGPNLQMAFDTSAEKPKATRVAEFLRAQEMSDPQALQMRIASMRVEQQKAQGLGNMEAVQTYNQVINALQAQLAKLQTGPAVADSASEVPPQNAAAPASQPAMMQAGVGANDATPGVGR